MSKGKSTSIVVPLSVPLQLITQATARPYVNRSKRLAALIEKGLRWEDAIEGDNASETLAERVAALAESLLLLENSMGQLGSVVSLMKDQIEGISVDLGTTPSLALAPKQKAARDPALDQDPLECFGDELRTGAVKRVTDETGKTSWVRIEESLDASPNRVVSTGSARDLV